MSKTNRLPNFVVPRSAIMSWMFSCKPESREDRPALRAIHFESQMEGPRKDKAMSIHAVATNGHHLIHLWWQAQPTDILDGEVDILSEDVSTLLAELNKGKGSPLAQGRDYGFRIQTDDDNYVLVASKKGEEPLWMDVGAIDHNRGSFPLWRDVLPKLEGEKGPACFGVDLEYVMTFHKFLKEFGHGTQMKVSCSSLLKAGPLLFAPLSSGEDESYDVEFLLMDQETAVEYVLMPVT